MTFSASPMASSTTTPLGVGVAAAHVDAFNHQASLVPYVDDMLIERAPRDAMVMIVDDEEINVDVVQAYLEEEGFQNFVTTTDSRKAIDLVQRNLPDVVLLDINMPHVNGLEVLRSMRLSPKLKRIPTIILTAETGSENKMKALRLGASDFLAKPVDPSELMLRLENVLAAKVYHDYLQDYSAELERQVRQRTAELEKSRYEAIKCLARAAEYRDDVTGKHVLRVGRYSAILAAKIGYSPAACQLIDQAAQLHDLGKIGIPDQILNKPGPLTPEEYAIVQQHCQIGVNIINPSNMPGGSAGGGGPNPSVDWKADASSPILQLAALIASTHHEKWDGSGYPNRLSGEAIPMEGRIVAVADVFDALTSQRSYKDAMTPEQSRDVVVQGRGGHFDPRVVDAFVTTFDMIRKTWAELKDQG